MRRIVDWLSKHRATNVAIVVLYFLAVALPHKAFGTFLNDVVFQGITFDQYNLYVISAFSIILGIVSFIFISNALKSNVRWQLIGYILATIAFAVLIINTLFVINIEVVHFPQYAVMAILLFPLIRHYHSTLIWTTIFGVVDEGYQFFYLAPNDTGYFDFNDVLTNLIGAAFGLLFLWSMKISSTKRVFLQSSSFYGLLIFSAIVTLSMMTGLLSVYVDPESSYHLVVRNPSSFWSKINLGIVYHVVRPLEGTLLTIGLWAFYLGLGHKTKDIDHQYSINSHPPH